MALANPTSVDLIKDFPWLQIKGTKTETRLVHDDQVASCVHRIAQQIQELLRSRQLTEGEVSVCLDEEEYSDTVYMSISVDAQKDACELITEIEDYYLEYIMHLTSSEQIHIMDHFLVRERMI